MRNTLTVFDRQGAEVLTYAKVHTSDFKHAEKDPVWARIDGNGQPYDASKR